MAEPQAAAVDGQVLAELQRKAALEGVDLSTYLLRLSNKGSGIRQFVPPTAEHLPRVKSFDETFSEMLNRQTQMWMMKGMSSMGGGEQRFPTATEIATELARVLHPQGTQTSGVNIQSIIDGTMAVRLAKSLMSEDSATGGPLKEFIDKQMAELTGQVRSLTTGLTQSEKQREADQHKHELELSQAQIDELNGQLADLKQRLDNPPNANQPQDLNAKVNELVSNLTALQTLSQRVQQVTGGHSTQQPGQKDFWGQLTEVLDGVSRAGANVAETASRISATRRGEGPPDYSQPTQNPQLYRTPYTAAPPAPATPPQPAAPPGSPATLPPAPIPAPPATPPLQQAPPAGGAFDLASVYGRGTPPPTKAAASPPVEETAQAAAAPESQPPLPEEPATVAAAPQPIAPTTLIEASPEQLATLFPANAKYLDPVSGEKLPRDAFIAKYGDVVLRHPEAIKVVSQ
jgi:hypothetical protein